MLAIFLLSVLALARVLSGLFSQTDWVSSDSLMETRLNKNSRVLEFHHLKDEVSHELFFRETVREEIGLMKSCH